MKSRTVTVACTALASLCVLASGGAVRAEPVALTNPGFEDVDLGPWATYGTVHDVTRDAPLSGFRALRLGISGTSGAAEEAGAYQDATLAASGTAALNVRVSANLAVDQAFTGDATAEVKVELYKKINGQSVGVESNAAIVAPAKVGGYAAFEVCAQAPAGYEVFARATILVGSNNGKGAGAVRVDDIAMTAGDDAVCKAPVAAADEGCGGGAAEGIAGLAAALSLVAWRRRNA